MLCNNCQARKATVHFTACSGASEDEPQKIDLCQECFDASDLKEQCALPADFQTTVQAGCKYCGGEAYGGGLDSLALLGGVYEMKVLCKPCAEEYFGFLGLKFPGLGDPDRTKEQAATLVASLKACDFPAILAELEEHMKQYVAKRKLH